MIAASNVGVDGMTAEELTECLSRLQRAVAGDDKAGVADLVSFPLVVNAANKKSKSVTALQFARTYSETFTEKVKRAVLAQRPNDMFRSWRGAMIGQGEVWLTAVCPDGGCTSHKVLITAINEF